MIEKSSQLERRDFLRAGVAFAAGAAALGGSSREATSAAPATKSSLPMRDFGKTGLKLPILGLGGAAIVGAWAQGYGVTLPSEEERAGLVRYAFDRGIRFFDNAPLYQEVESIMGQGLKGVRQQAFLATKVWKPQPETVRPSIEQSLKQLQTDYLDLVQIHSPMIEQVGYREAMKVHAELVKLRDEKIIKFIGVTTHVAFEDVYQMISTGGFDQVLLACGYFNKGFDQMLSHRTLEWRAQCLAKAHELGLAVVAMKVMGAGVFGHNSATYVADYDAERRQQLAAAALRWVANDSRIALLNVGASLRADIDRNVATLTGDLSVTDDDRMLLADFSRRCYDSDPIKQMKVV